MPKSRDLNIDERLEGVVGETRRPKLEPETGWWILGAALGGLPKQARDIPFEGAWDHADIDTWPASWYQSTNGEVRMKGKVMGDVAGTTVFTLPEEDVPEHEETFIVSVDDDGNIDLSGIRFRAWQNGDSEE